MEYNKNRYIELLKQSQCLQNKGKSIWYEKEKCLELNKYGIMLEDHFYWKNRATYTTLIQSYLIGTINLQEFQTKFFQFYRMDRKISKKVEQDFKKLDNFTPNSKSKGFSYLVTIIFEDFDAEPGDSDGMTLDQFQNSIEKIYFKMQKYS